MVNLLNKKPRLSLETIDIFNAGDYEELTREQLLALALYYKWEENVELVDTVTEEDHNFRLED
jgi:hypothetical protein